MNLVQRYRSRLTGKLPVITLILFLLQPLMDVLSFWILEWGLSNTVTLLLRLAVLGGMVLTGFALTRRRKVYYWTAAVCGLIGICHMAACFHFGYQSIVTDLSNYIRVLQLPLTVLCLITFIKEDALCYNAIRSGIALNVTVILAVQLLAILTGTEPHTYFDGSGYIGWFSNTNTQSAILTMASPVAVVWLYQKKGLKHIWFWLVFLGSSLSMFQLGTRLAFVAILGMSFGIGISMLIIRLKDWKKAAAFLLVGVLFIVMLPLSPMMSHRKIHADDMSMKQGWIDHEIENPKDEDPEEEDGPPPLAGEPLDLTPEQRELVEKLTPIYEHYLYDFVSIFGAERTIHMYNYTDDILVMSATRDKKLMFAEALMDASPITAKLFGLELTRFTIKGHNYDVENDFHGIYYLYGILGLAAMALFILYFLYLIVRGLIRNFRRYFTLDAAAWGIGLVFCLGHCAFTAGVLRRPSASFYMAAIFAAVYYLLKLKKYSEKPEV